MGSFRLVFGPPYSFAPCRGCYFQPAVSVFQIMGYDTGWRTKKRKRTKWVALKSRDWQLDFRDCSPKTSTVVNGVFLTGRCRRQWRRKSVSGKVETDNNSSFAKDQVYQLPDEESSHFWNGPLPGDLAELEAFCRIFRLSEQLHNAVMNALNSLSYSKRSWEFLDGSYGRLLSEPVLSDAENRLLLEQKVVAGLGCIGALLYQQKQKVHGGSLRSGRASENLHGMVEDVSTPPLAHFRAEMKKCCQQLELAVSHCFPPVDKQSSDIHKRFRRLRNACFDVGYPRPEGSPSHEVVPNWAPVQFSCGRGGENPGINGEVMFYQGGQVTEEGIKWLLENGFRTIVDLRAENDTDQLAKAAIGNAISLSQLRLVRLPVELGYVPTKEQVETFAELVGDPRNQLLYLQSQEGIGRTSAMVSRWRELNLHRKSQGLTEISFKTNGFSSQGCNAGEYPRIGGDNGDVTPAVQECFGEALNEDWQDSFSLTTLDSICNSETDISCVDAFDADCHCENDVLDSRIETSVYAGQDNLSNVAALESKKEMEEKSCIQCSVTEGISGRVSPLDAQMPSQNVFSRQAMSNFRKGRKVVPAEFVCKHGEIDTRAVVSPPSEDQRIIEYGSIAGPAGQWDLSGLGIPRAGISSEDLELDTEIQSQEQDGLKVNMTTSDGVPGITEKVGNSDTSNSEIFDKQRDPDGSFLSQKKSPGADRLYNGIGDEGSDDDSDESGIVGDMCASTTGVVRLQSRKKAEMYLVRTDGFSCTREKVKESTLAFTHPSTQQQMLMWKTAPKTVLLLKKLGDELMDEAQQVALFLHYQEGMNVVVEPEVHDCFARVPGFGFVQTFYIQDTSDLHERVDFVVCLGGDGVILHVSNLFRSAVPPVVSFNLGSLGFLTTHPFEDFKQDLHAIIHGNTRVEGVYITLRMRLQCELFRNGKSIPNKVIDVLNEVVLDRGSNPYLCKIECYEHNRLITKVQADGVIVATPTGSTAYSTAAGGSMVHPNVPCILFTPICPHSLSFRPVILPDSAQLELKVPHDARSNAWVSFDGKRRQQLSKGDSVRICMSKHPLPTVNKSDQTDDWFRSLVRCLNWNERLEQKALTASF